MRETMKNNINYLPSRYKTLDNMDGFKQFGDHLQQHGPSTGDAEINYCIQIQTSELVGIIKIEEKRMLENQVGTGILIREWKRIPTRNKRQEGKNALGKTVTVFGVSQMNELF